MGKILAMSDDKSWKQVTIKHRTPQSLNEQTWRDVERVERAAESDVLYFARYSDTTGHKLVVKVFTSCPRGQLARRLRLKAPDVFTLDSASHAHALAYRIAKAARAQAKPDVLVHDVIHWLMNMMGHGYSAEALEYIKMSYNAVQNLRVGIGEIKPDAPPAPTIYEGVCGKCGAKVTGTEAGRRPCFTGAPKKKACGGFAMLAFVKGKE